MTDKNDKVDKNDRKLIYIADDDYSIREAIKAFLESSDYVVKAFETGDALLLEFGRKPSDMVILDVMMPGKHNGFSVLKEIRAVSIVPIIMLTARDSDLDYQTGLDLGSDDFFTKPVSPMNLVMRVKAIFRRIEYERTAYENILAKKS